MGGMAARLEGQETDILVSVAIDNNLDEELAIFNRLAASGKVDGTSSTRPARRMNAWPC